MLIRTGDASVQHSDTHHLSKVLRVMNDAHDRPNDHLCHSFIQTPLGMMISIFSPKGLCLLEFLDNKTLVNDIHAIIKVFNSHLPPNNSKAIKLQHQLNRYFDGTLTQFSIPLDMIGTEFERKVWHELMNIDYGQTISYSEQAKKMSMPNATRAVASANGKNKIAIIIPCHRVRLKNGKIGGYSSGTTRKKLLLQLESSTSNTQLI